jgi:hypothetical protein
VLHPEGEAIDPAKNDPWGEFNAQANAYILDQQMPPANQVSGIIELQAYRRNRR